MPPDITFPPARYLGSYTADLPAPTLPEIAFAGRSNAGKSSALNALLGARIARTSNTPGRTQAINLFQIGEPAAKGAAPDKKRPRVPPWIAADLPGYGYAKVGHDLREAWRGLIESYVNDRDALRLVLVLVDSRIPGQALDRQLLEWLTAVGRDWRVLATKIDGVPRARREAEVARLALELRVHPEAIIGFSAVEDIGRAEARKVIRGAIKGRPVDEGAPG